MNIVVIGSGTVGTAICAQLTREGHDITVVDMDAATLTELSNAYDTIGVVGNGAEVSVLKKAGAERADLLIAVTCQDEVNILACAAAKKLGTRHTVARVRNPEYSGLMQLMRNEMNLSMTINPERAAAKTIYTMLRFPAAAKIDSFVRGRVELAQFTVDAASPLCGIPLTELRSRTNIRFLVCSVTRGGEAYIPDGNFVLQGGDEICVTAPDEEVSRFFKAVGVYKHPVRDVLVVGGGRITYYLLELLGSRIRATVIEKDRTLCRELAEAFPHATVICDNGTKQSLLEEEGLEHTDAFLALSAVDEENAIVSMYAKTRRVPKVITLINSLSYVDFFKGVGLESIVSPQSSSAASVLRYVRAMVNAQDSGIESLHKIMDGKVEALEFSVREDIPNLTGLPLKRLHCRPGVLVACIVREDAVLFPTGEDVLQKGDTVIVVTNTKQMNSIKDILQ